MSTKTRYAICYTKYIAPIGFVFVYLNLQYNKHRPVIYGKQLINGNPQYLHIQYIYVGYSMEQPLSISCHIWLIIYPLTFQLFRFFPTFPLRNRLLIWRGVATAVPTVGTPCTTRGARPNPMKGSKHSPCQGLHQLSHLYGKSTLKRRTGLLLSP